MRHFKFDLLLCSPDVKDDKLKPQVEEDGTEDKKEEAEEVKKTLEDSLLKDKEEEGKGEVVDEDQEEEEQEEEVVNQEQEASPATDTSCLPQPALSEEDVPPASPGSSSRPSSSVDSPR